MGISEVGTDSAAAQQHKERVRLGKEPPLSGIEGRVMRLCGNHSPMTQVSMMRMGEHIMPVYEQTPKVIIACSLTESEPLANASSTTTGNRASVVRPHCARVLASRRG